MTVVLNDLVTIWFPAVDGGSTGWVDKLTPSGWSNSGVKGRRVDGWIELRGYNHFPTLSSGSPTLLPAARRPATSRYTEQPRHASGSPRNIVCNNDFNPDGTVGIHTDHSLIQLRFNGFRIWGD